MRSRFWFPVLLLVLLQQGQAAAAVSVRPPERGPFEISEPALLKTVEEMAAFGNRTTWEKQNAVANDLHRRLKKIKGLEVSFHPYAVGRQTYKNVVARVPGRKDGPVLIFCAHYDSHPAGLAASGRAPGADDNATGVAVLLEGARVLAANPGNRPVELVFFPNEEQEDHKGSKAYVKAMAAQGRLIREVVNIDAIGYTQPSLTVLWKETRGKGLWRGWIHLAKQVLRKPVYYVRTGFRNPDELLRIGGRPANAPLVEKIYSRLKGAEVGLVKDIGPQCG